MEHKGKRRKFPDGMCKGMDPRDKAAQMKAVGDWYEKKHRLNYRTVPLESGENDAGPGKGSLGKKMNFSELIERSWITISWEKISWNDEKLIP